MRIRLFCHSLLSDWNHGNAHFLRGVVWELVRRGHEVRVYEPARGWSRENLLLDHGTAPIAGFRARYFPLDSELYELDQGWLEAALEGADLVIVHEWSEPELVARVGHMRAQSPGWMLLFHDTHHRAVTEYDAMRRYDLRHYDGVLAFGEVLRRLYLERGLAARAFTWHEAADVRVFCPQRSEPERDLVWIGNWGDGERTQELREFLVEPARRLRLRARVYGVRYPQTALAELAAAGIDYAGFLPNYRAPEVFARHAFTVHVPRRPYVEALAGVPTIRVFEALASGIPLLSAPWHDAEALFRPGQDFLFARDGAHMEQLMRQLLHEPELRRALAENGLTTIRARHTCAHRVDELFAICRTLGATAPQLAATAPRAPQPKGALCRVL